MSTQRARAVMLVCAVMGLTVAAGAQVADPISDVAAERSTIEIPGTVVAIDLAKVSRDDGKVSRDDGKASRDDGADLWVSTTEVTWDLYDVYLYALDVPEGDQDIEAVTRPSKPYVPPDRGMGHAGFPAMGMTRQAAESFCAWFEATTGLAARLPSAEEFEHFAAVDSLLPLDGVAWTAANSGNKTHAAGQKPANAFGLHDTLGNVAEWVAGEGRAQAMGGSYRDDDDGCTPASVQRQARSWNQSDPQIPKSRWWLADCSWVGFRIVIEGPIDEPIQEPIQEPIDE